MIEDDDKPIDRDAWRRLLSRGADVPPRATDERIRAEARRALAPHTGRWWLPASLAASLLLAVLIVQWQYEPIRAPEVMTESEIAPARENAEERERQAGPLATDDRAADESQAGKFAAPPAPVSSAPVQEPSPFTPSYDLPAPAPAATAAQQPASPDVPVSQEQLDRAEIAPQRAANGVGAAAKTEARSAALQRAQPSAEVPRNPEEWYAQIEALRAAGRDEEAKAELEKLEAAYPGWLKEHLRERQ